MRPRRTTRYRMQRPTCCEAPEPPGMGRSPGREWLENFSGGGRAARDAPEWHCHRDHKPQPATGSQCARPLCPTGLTARQADPQVLRDGGSPAWHSTGAMAIFVPANVPKQMFVPSPGRQFLAHL